MNESERYNLLWLLRALTLPINYNVERYYFDGQRKDLFYTIQEPGSPSITAILNKFDLQYSHEIESDLTVRLLLIEDDSSEIVEIPRINVAEKIQIQLDFLSRMPGTYWHNELIAAVEQQEDDYKFVLDTVLIENDNSAPLYSYWEDYKFNLVYRYFYISLL